MTHQSRVKAFFKGIGVWLVSYTLLVLILTIVMMVVIFVVGKTSPETLKNWLK